MNSDVKLTQCEEDSEVCDQKMLLVACCTCLPKPAYAVGLFHAEPILSIYKENLVEQLWSNVQGIIWLMSSDGQTHG